jgi:preprotein translocase subunit YajC/DNA-binding CsgD family transcriptional regulator
MIDPFVAVYTFLFLFTACLTLFYYLKIRQASKEYMKAKKVLDDIVFSFNKELHTEGDKIREDTQKNSIKIGEALDSLAHIEPKVKDLEDRVKKIEDTTITITNNQESLKKEITNSLKRQSEPLKETMMTSITSGGQESGNLIAPPIPLRKERALGSLTDTEIQILKLLARQSEKTAIQIRSEINLTREHTARLMKKLYISGYVERRTDRTPYVYRLKKEMEGLLDINSS